MSPSKSLSAADQDFLGGLTIFEGVPERIRTLVARSFVRDFIDFGESLIEEGRTGDALFVLVDGTARVVRLQPDGNEVTVRRLGPGESVGAASLVYGTPAQATVRASGPVLALRLDGEVFRTLVASYPEVTEWINAELWREHLHDFLRTQVELGALDDAAIDDLIAHLRPIAVDAGVTVVREGDAGGPMYFVDDGRLRVFRGSGGDEYHVDYLRAGDIFGEDAAMTGGVRGASVATVGACRLLQLEAPDTQAIAARHRPFRKSLEGRIESYRYQPAPRVPLDFQEALPADTRTLAAITPEMARQAAGAEPPPAVPVAAAEVPTLDDETPLPSSGRARKVPLVWQVDETDCGAACLAMLCRYHGRDVPLVHVRALVNTSNDGTSLGGLIAGAEDLGFDARPLKSSAANLDRLPLPAIAHWGGNHWVVLERVERDRVRVADPASGHKRIPREEFAEQWTGYVGLFTPTSALDQAPDDKPSLAWMAPFVRPHLRALLLALALAMAVAALQAALPIFTKIVVDEVIPDADRGKLAIVVIGLSGVLVVTVAATLFQGYLLSRVAVKLDSATLDHITGRMLALPMRYFTSRRTGDIERRLAGVQQIRQFIVQSAVQAVTAIVTLVVVLIVMFATEVTMALVFVAITPLYVALMQFSKRRLRPVFETLEEAFAKYQSHQIDAIRGMETVKAAGAEDALARAIAREFGALADKRFRADFTILTYTGLVRLTTFFTLALFLYLGAVRVLDGSLTLGGLIAFNSLVILANAPLLILLSLWDEYQSSSVLLNRLNDILGQEPEQGSDHSRLRPVKTLEGTIVVENLGFRFGGPRSAEILHDLDFVVPAGSTCAIVGRSGSGKTTLIKCLAGLLEPTEGRITYDGIDLRELDYRTLRRQIGFVLQENYLFDDTIAANVAFGSEEPDLERVKWAARVANAHAFIERLPLAYETKIGNSGLLLSGGQRQRIAIARAVYRRPPVLIFDEATSALDTESERAVQESMDQLLADRTSFVIAHRLSTIRNADLIIVLDDGRIVEQGTHNELLARQGLYHHLCHRQLDL